MTAIENKEYITTSDLTILPPSPLSSASGRKLSHVDKEMFELVKDSAIEESKGGRGGHSLDGLVGREEARNGQKNGQVVASVGGELDPAGGHVGVGDGLVGGDYGAVGAVGGEAFEADDRQQQQRRQHHHYLDDQVERLESSMQQQQQQRHHSLSALPYGWWQQESPAGSWPEFRGVKYRGCAMEEGSEAQAAGG